MIKLCPTEAINARRFISRNQVEGAEGELLPALYGPLGSSGTIESVVQVRSFRFGHHVASFVDF